LASSFFGLSISKELGSSIYHSAGVSSCAA
jgi:hypothetical protein